MWQPSSSLATDSKLGLINIKEMRRWSERLDASVLRSNKRTAASPDTFAKLRFMVFRPSGDAVPTCWANSRIAHKHERQRRGWKGEGQGTMKASQRGGKKKVAKADRSAESRHPIDEQLSRHSLDFNTILRTTDGPVTLFPTATRQKQNFCSGEGRAQFNVRLQWVWVWCRSAKGGAPVFPLVFDKCKCNSLEICSAKINA